MFKKVLLASIIVHGPLINDQMTEEARYNKIAPYFVIPPGGEVVIDPKSPLNYNVKNPLDYRGEIRIKKLPLNTCFTITRDFSLPDEVICKPKSFTFKVSEINKKGEITRIISTGHGDIGYKYSWKTPHILASVIPAGAKLKDLSYLVPIYRCIAQKSAIKRRIVLMLMNGKEWIIDFPLKDKLMDQPKKFPNLYISRGVSGGVDKNSQVKVIGTRLIKGEFNDPVTKYWAIPVRRSFIMKGGNFKTTDSPSGINGVCRYQYNNAPQNKNSGWIECHNIDKYDVIYTYLTCISKLR